MARKSSASDVPNALQRGRDSLVDGVKYCRTAWNTLPHLRYPNSKLIPAGLVKDGQAFMAFSSGHLKKKLAWIEQKIAPALKTLRARRPKTSAASKIHKNISKQLTQVTKSVFGWVTLLVQRSKQVVNSALSWKSSRHDPNTSPTSKKSPSKPQPKPILAQKIISVRQKAGTIFDSKELLPLTTKLGQLFSAWFFPATTWRYRLAIPTTITATERQFFQRAQLVFSWLAKKLTKLRRRVTSLDPSTHQVFQPVTTPIGAGLKTLWSPFGYVLREFPLHVLGSILMSTGILLGAYGLYDYVFRDLPTADQLIERDPIVSTKILDRNGELLYSFYEDENRTIIPLSSVPQHVINATIAIEDQNFYHHHGFDLRGIIRALIANLNGEPVQGGSTITQQLVKNTLLTPERSLRRKIRELLLAIIIDGSFTKDQILEMYFNEIPYGGATYGIEEAAQRYFGKSASELSLAEGAFLAGLPAAPTAYSPFGSTPELAYARQREVLRRMVEDNFITEAELASASAEVLDFAPNRIDIVAPHFVFYVRDLLAQQYGEAALTQGGLLVRTTLDLDTQNLAQAAVTDEVDRLARLRVSNGAALVTQPATGEILAMVGSRDYFDFANDGQVNVVLRPRQPGSSIKPLTYATAMERGIITPSSIINDSPVRYDIAGSQPYAPKNYDGKFRGRVTVRESLASSYNIPAVKTLAQVGVATVIDKGEELGITTWTDRRRFGLSLTLGGGEVLMKDLAQLYSAFANYGYAVEPNPILEVTNYKGDVLYRNDCALDSDNCFGRRQLDSRVAYQITDILSDNRARTPAFGPQSVLHLPGQDVAVKTGTTNSLRDNWTIGYTTDVLVAVWVGNNDNTPMSYVASGITGASPIWNTIISGFLSDENPHDFPTPDGLKKVEICKTTGTLPCTGCPWVAEELFIPGTEPTNACNPAQFRPKPSPEVGPDGQPVEQRDQILDGVGD